MPFEDFFLRRGVGADRAKQLALEVQTQYPWLDFSSELSESLAEDLFGPEESLSWLEDADIAEFVDWYNATIDGGSTSLSKEKSNAAYVDLLHVVKNHGQEDAFGEGDFWVIEDSMAGSRPVIVLFQDGALTKQLASDLVAWRSRHRQFEGLLVTNRDGDVIRGF